MPELPEVETVRLGLRPVMEGAHIDRVELQRGDLRRPFPGDFARRLAGRTVTALRRRAKYLVAALDDGTCLVMHLGMSGSFRIETGEGTAAPGAFHHPKGRKGPHDHVAFHLRSGARIIYNDPRRFGLMDLLPCDELGESPAFRSLGIEPLGRELTPGWLGGAFRGRRTSIKAALLDQRLVAGLGNIYVCEALWEARVSPLREAASLAGREGRPTAATRRLAEAIPAVMKRAIAAGGSSLRNHARTDGSLGDFQHQFKVYGRTGAPCERRGCRGVIRRIVQGGRSTYYCPACQK